MTGGRMTGGQAAQPIRRGAGRKPGGSCSEGAAQQVVRTVGQEGQGHAVLQGQGGRGGGGGAEVVSRRERAVPARTRSTRAHNPQKKP